MIPAQLLISFAKNRKSAYKAYGALNTEREKAAARILEVCQFFLKTPKSGWVSQIKEEITILLPESESDDAHWIEKVNNLLNN